MSHAYGEIIKDGAVIAHFEYSGTSDICCPRLYATQDEVTENWRKGPWVECTCGAAGVDVLIYSDYGGGFYWPGQVCLTCMAITKNFGSGSAAAYDGDHPDSISGHPLGRRREA